MSKVNLGAPIGGSAEQKLDWCVRSLKRLEQALNVSLLEVTADNFTFSNVTEGRTIDINTATVEDVANAFATFLADIKKRGSKASST